MCGVVCLNRGWRHISNHVIQFHECFCITTVSGTVQGTAMQVIISLSVLDDLIRQVLISPFLQSKIIKQLNRDQGWAFTLRFSGNNFRIFSYITTGLFGIYSFYLLIAVISILPQKNKLFFVTFVLRFKSRHIYGDLKMFQNPF